MPRWFTVILAWTLFTAVMLAVGWVLKLVVPGIIDRLWSAIGGGGVWTILCLVVGLAAVFGYWPRDSAGRMRRLPLRR